TTASAVSITVAVPVNVPPVVAITFPADNTVFVAPATFTIQVTASDSDGIVSEVEFFEGSISLGIAPTSPYSLVWSDVIAGSYSLTAVATDDNGATTVSAPVSIVVKSGTVAPLMLVTPMAETDQFSFSLATEP